MSRFRRPPSARIPEDIHSDPPADPPVRVVEVPVLAYKRANLGWAPGGKWTLTTNYTGQLLVADADAECRYGVRHEAPEVTCGCGFHALKSPDDLSDSYGNVLVDVELSGRIIVASGGYRAQHQRVLEVHPPPCWYCGAPPTVIAIIEMWFGGGSSQTPSYGPVTRALCADHRDAHAAHAVALEDISARLLIPFGPQ